jgi:type III secretion protein V
MSKLASFPAFPPSGSASPGALFRSLPLAVVVAVTLALLVVPLPGVVLDGFLAANVGLGVLLLAVVLEVRRASALGSFPVLLLLGALYRIALSVASARAILAGGTSASTGRVIDGFGHAVTRGSLLTGVVLFALLVLVQFVVVTKGAERVAEVGARFALDALPGKQLAIDGDLRAGVVDGDGAAVRRQLLERESRFFGAMDGAMKFVRGEVLASLAITFLNFVAGTAIGLLDRDLAFGDAVGRYGTLAIGEGLAMQLPALLSSLAGALLVTRAASDSDAADPDSNDDPGDGPLGGRIGVDLGRAPRAFFLAAPLLLLVGLAPGLPLVPFGAVAAALVGLGLLATRRAVPPRAPLRAWSIGLPPGRAGDASRLEAALRKALGTWTEQSGLPLPIGAIEIVPKAEGPLLCIGEVPIQPLVGAHTVPEIAEEAVAVLARYADEFMDVSVARTLLDRVARDGNRALVEAAVPRILPLPRFADLLRALVRERTPLRDVRPVLQAIVADNGTTRGDDLVEMARRALSRPLTYRMTAGSGEVVVITVDGTLEAMLADAPRTASGTPLLAPALARDFQRAARRAIDAARHQGNGRPIAVFATATHRAVVRAWLGKDYPMIPVTCAAELLPETTIRVLERIGLE